MCCLYVKSYLVTLCVFACPVSNYQLICLLLWQTCWMNVRGGYCIMSRWSRWHRQQRHWWNQSATFSLTLPVLPISNMSGPCLRLVVVFFVTVPVIHKQPDVYKRHLIIVMFAVAVSLTIFLHGWYHNTSGQCSEDWLSAFVVVDHNHL